MTNQPIPVSLDGLSVGRSSTSPFIDILKPRDPLTTDNIYSIQQKWLNTSTGSFWILQNYTSPLGNLTAHWVELGMGGMTTETLTANSGIATAVANNINVLGSSVAAGTAPVKTVASGSTLTVDVQTAQAIASTDATKIGLAAFNSSEFTVDANGFVGLVGGGVAIEKVNVQTGTSPIVPTSGAITLNGAVVAAGTNPIRTDGTGANTAAIEVQISQAIASTDATKIGLAAFKSSQFTVDANGFVSVTGGVFNSIIVQTFTSSGTYTPTAGMLYCTIECVGGGGGGGSTLNTGANNVSVGAGGGGGGYSRKTVTAATIGASKAVTIGAAGAGGAAGGGAGGTGGTSSVGVIVSSTGGSPGGSSASGSNPGDNNTGGAGGVGSSGDINISGNGGGAGSAFAAGGSSTSFGGAGGGSYFGGGALGTSSTSAGANAGNYGGGGAGATTPPNSSQNAGGNGAAGVVIITEYI